MIGDALFGVAFALMTLPPVAVYVVLMFRRDRQPRPAAPPADKGGMTRAGVPYVLGK